MQKKDRYYPELIARLREKYGVGKRYITMSIRGDRKSEVSDLIKKDYRRWAKKADEAIKEALKK